MTLRAPISIQEGNEQVKNKGNKNRDDQELAVFFLEISSRKQRSAQ
jgi:hypothetical protein